VSEWPVLHTERLTLRMLTGEDFDAYARIQGDDETMRYLNGQAMTRDDAYRHLSYLLGQWLMRGYGYWGVVENETNELVGRVGFHNPEGWPGFELGWTIARDRWGRGYATEAARRALRYAFEELGQQHVISLIHPDNVASIAVAKKIGETLEGETTLFGTKPALIYGISAASPA
jgi:RimJ/RimL family protein N-acetyltransferase